MLKKLHIYTDGACRGNPGPGGWGALVIDGNLITEFFGAMQDTTNNRMELWAIIQALRTVHDRSHAIITTDSQYVIKGITEWLPQWKRRGWKTASNTAVKNQDLWQSLDQETQKHQVEWEWVKGHNGHWQNERADQLANKAIDNLLCAK